MCTPRPRNLLALFELHGRVSSHLPKRVQPAFATIVRAPNTYFMLVNCLPTGAHDLNLAFSCDIYGQIRLQIVSTRVGNVPEGYRCTWICGQLRSVSSKWLEVAANTNTRGLNAVVEECEDHDGERGPPVA